MDASQESDSLHVIGNLQTHLSELEMLQSVFCNPGEILFEDFITIADINDYINGKSKILPSFLNYTVNLNIDTVKVNINVTLPHQYPDVKPEILLRVNNFNRTQQNKLNIDLKACISELESGEVCVFSIITWIQENILNYIEQEINITEEEEIKDKSARFWIYSHHIYSNSKRKEILSLAEDYSLTGFCLPGKPGVICLEGFLKDCNAWWVYIRNLPWQKIMCKRVEIDENAELCAFRKFSKFEEIVFQNAKVKSTHMDMGEFYNYLEKHCCEYIFKDLFGVDSKNV